MAVWQGGPGSRSRGHAGTAPAVGGPLPGSATPMDSNDEEYSPAASSEDSGRPQQNGKRGLEHTREEQSRRPPTGLQSHKFGVPSLPGMAAPEAAPRQVPEWRAQNGAPVPSTDLMLAARLSNPDPSLLAQLQSQQARARVPPSPTFVVGSRVAKLVAAAAEHLTKSQQVRHSPRGLVFHPRAVSEPRV